MEHGWTHPSSNEHIMYTRFLFNSWWWHFLCFTPEWISLLLRANNIIIYSIKLFCLATSICYLLLSFVVVVVVLPSLLVFSVHLCFGLLIILSLSFSTFDFFFIWILDMTSIVSSPPPLTPTTSHAMPMRWLCYALLRYQLDFTNEIFVNLWNWHSFSLNEMNN